MMEEQETPALNRVLAWLRQPTTVGGIAGIAGILTAVSQGQMDWGQALPLLVTAVILIVVPEAAGDVKIDQLVGGAIKTNQVVVRRRVVAADMEDAPAKPATLPAAAPAIITAPAPTPTEATLREQVEALTRAVAALSQRNAPSATPLLDAFEQPLPAFGSDTPGLVRLQEALRPVPRPLAKLKQKARSAKAPADPVPNLSTPDVFARTVWAEAGVG